MHKQSEIGDRVANNSMPNPIKLLKWGSHQENALKLGYEGQDDGCHTLSKIEIIIISPYL